MSFELVSLFWSTTDFFHVHNTCKTILFVYESKRLEKGFKMLSRKGKKRPFNERHVQYLKYLLLQILKFYSELYIENYPKMFADGVFAF